MTTEAYQYVEKISDKTHEHHAKEVRHHNTMTAETVTAAPHGQTLSADNVDHNFFCRKTMSIRVGGTWGCRHCRLTTQHAFCFIIVEMAQNVS